MTGGRKEGRGRGEGASLGHLLRQYGGWCDTLASPRPLVFCCFFFFTFFLYTWFFLLYLRFPLKYPRCFFWFFFKQLLLHKPSISSSSSSLESTWKHHLQTEFWPQGATPPDLALLWFHPAAFLANVSIHLERVESLFAGVFRFLWSVFF